MPTAQEYGKKGDDEVEEQVLFPQPVNTRGLVSGFHPSVLLLVFVVFTFISGTAGAAVGLLFARAQQPVLAPKPVQPQPQQPFLAPPQQPVQPTSESSCLPSWFDDPAEFVRIVKQNSPMTDKVTVHAYQHAYVKYLGRIARHKCAGQTAEERTLRLIEIGLGCGMPKGPGGGVRIWRQLFKPPIILDLHIMEFAGPCAKAWVAANPGLVTNPTVQVHTGNQFSAVDLERVYQEAGGKPFDAIIDDGSHINEHMKFTLRTWFPRVAPGGVYFLEDVHASCVDAHVNRGGAPVPAGESATMGGGKDCLTTTAGKSTAIGMAVKLIIGLTGRRQLARELPGLVHIDSFSELIVFEKEF